MNYTVKSSGNSFSIGSQEFTSTPIDLVSISCLTPNYFPELLRSAIDQDILILKNGVQVEFGGHVVSKLITIVESGCISVDFKLNEDWTNK